MNIVKWEDISEYARGLFSVWAGDEGIKWAEKGWKAIDNAGLTSYSNEIQRHSVIIRLMTLATIYHEFYDLVFDEYFSRDDIQDWIYESESLNFHKIRIWQLIGKDFYENNDLFECLDEYYDELNLLIEAVNELIDDHREEIYSALVKYYTDDVDLFISLLSQAYSEFNEESVDIEDLSRGEEMGMQWIFIGMPRSPRENI